VRKLANTESAHTRRIKAVEAITSMGMNIKEAAAYAGLSPVSVSNILKDERVVAYIEKVRKQHAERFEVKRENVIEGVLDAIERAKMLGEPATEIRGWESIAKLQGLNAPERVVHELPEDVRELTATIKSMNSADVMRLAGQKNIIELTEDDFEEVDDE